MKLISNLITAFVVVMSMNIQAQLLSSSEWQPDVLNGFEDKEFVFTDDYDGAVTAHLVRKLADEPSTKAVLYVHGFVDYFFQEEMAERFIEQGYNFYAIDLRKHGRSLLPNQHPNFMFSVEEFYDDLNAAIDVIRNQDGNEKLLLSAHSTGGPITALYVQDHKDEGLVDAIVYNSPFFDVNDSFVNINNRLSLPLMIKSAALMNPFGESGMTVPVQYGQSLHVSEYGEWDFDLNWKPVEGFPIYWGWMKGIMDAHQRLKRGLDLPVPVLVMYSSKSSSTILSPWKDSFFETDVVLDVNDIDRVADLLGRHVTEIRVDGGVHDLLLSKESVRNLVYKDMMTWVNAYVK